MTPCESVRMTHAMENFIQHNSLVDQIVQGLEKKILDRTFHETLIHSCKDKSLIQLINNFSKQTMRYRLKASSVPGWMNSSVKIHEGILKSFESGDAEKAEEIKKRWS
jgi:DNA-binding GntR family transcriptional regulator